MSVLRWSWRERRRVVAAPPCLEGLEDRTAPAVVAATALGLPALSAAGASALEAASAYALQTVEAANSAVVPTIVAASAYAVQTVEAATSAALSTLTPSNAPGSDGPTHSSTASASTGDAAPPSGDGGAADGTALTKDSEGNDQTEKGLANGQAPHRIVDIDSDSILTRNLFSPGQVLGALVSRLEVSRQIQPQDLVSGANVGVLEGFGSFNGSRGFGPGAGGGLAGGPGVEGGASAGRIAFHGDAALALAQFTGGPSSGGSRAQGLDFRPLNATGVGVVGTVLTGIENNGEDPPAPRPGLPPVTLRVSGAAQGSEAAAPPAQSSGTTLKQFLLGGAVPIGPGPADTRRVEIGAAPPPADARNTTVLDTLYSGGWQAAEPDDFPADTGSATEAVVFLGGVVGLVGDDGLSGARRRANR